MGSPHHLTKDNIDEAYAFELSLLGKLMEEFEEQIIVMFKIEEHQKQGHYQVLAR
jgi:hypothetical protein